MTLMTAAFSTTGRCSSIPKWLVMQQAKVMHGIEDTPVHRLETILDIWQCPAHYYRHCILHEPWCISVPLVEQC